MRKTLLIATIAFIMLSSCRPTSLWFVTPEGPAEYQLGWQDGCDTGLSAEDDGYLYRAVYGFKKRPELMDNDLYKQGWNEGFTYCRFMLDSQQR